MSKIKMSQSTINKLMSDPTLKVTAEANKAKAVKRREADLIMYGYNLALLTNDLIPEGFTPQEWRSIIEGQKARLGIE